MGIGHNGIEVSKVYMGPKVYFERYGVEVSKVYMITRYLSKGRE